MGFNGIYATYCVFRRKSPILKKILQCIILQPEYCKSYNMYTPICTHPPPNILQSFLYIYALLTPSPVHRGGVSPLPYSASGKLPRPCSANGRYNITLPIARTAGVPATGFRERALPHCTTLFRGQQCFAPIVILSRRTCGVSKNLTRLPKSGCNAIIPTFLYSRPIMPLPDPSTSSLAFRSALRSG